MSPSVKHFLRHYGEMVLPTFAVIGVLTSGLLTDIGVLMLAEHVVMLLAMAGVMLLRPHEYIHHHAQVTA
jgi:hypothetical protein